MCVHRPVCPPADDAGAGAAQEVARHPELGWSLLCNGVLVPEADDEGWGLGDPEEFEDLATLSLAELAAELTRLGSDLQAGFDRWRWRVPASPAQDRSAGRRVVQHFRDSAG